MKKAHSHTSLSNVLSETQKLRRQNANVLLSRSFCCLLSHVVVEFPNSRHMYALRTYFLKWHEFAIKFNLNVPFTTYYGLVNAIPEKWKANLRNLLISAIPQRQTNAEGCRIFGDLDQLKSKDTMQKTVD